MVQYLLFLTLRESQKQRNIINKNINMLFNSQKLYDFSIDKVLTILKRKLEEYLLDDEIVSLFEVIVKIV